MNHTARLLLAGTLALSSCVPWARIDLPENLVSRPDDAGTATDGATADRAQVIAVDVPNADVTIVDTGDAVVVWITDRPAADVPAVDAGVPPVDVASADAGTAVADVGAPQDATDVQMTPDVPAVDAPLVCNGILMACDGACINPLADPTHCGDCWTQCPSTRTGAGVCRGGRCDVACAAGYATCATGGACETVLATDHANCGMCGRGCGDGAVCSDGQCLACPSGQAACDGRCQRLDTAEHCGSCSHRCPLGARCAAGNTCEYTGCAAGRDAGTWTQCPDGCVDVRSDDRNCLGCGNVCVAGTHCRSGCN